jgi:hypothetical protein
MKLNFSLVRAAFEDAIEFDGWRLVAGLTKKAGLAGLGFEE